jgi:hypothetical protein
LRRIHQIKIREIEDLYRNSWERLVHATGKPRALLVEAEAAGTWTRFVDQVKPMLSGICEDMLEIYPRLIGAPPNPIGGKA